MNDHQSNIWVRSGRVLYIYDSVFLATFKIRGPHLVLIRLVKIVKVSQVKYSGYINNIFSLEVFLQFVSMERGMNNWTLMWRQMKHNFIVVDYFLIVENWPNFKFICVLELSWLARGNRAGRSRHNILMVIKPEFGYSPVITPIWKWVQL